MNLMAKVTLIILSMIPMNASLLVERLNTAKEFKVYFRIKMAPTIKEALKPMGALILEQHIIQTEQL